MVEEALMTLREVADMLRLSHQTIYKLLKEGRIPAMKVGSQWRFDRRMVLDWMAAEAKNEVVESAEKKSA